MHKVSECGLRLRYEEFLYSYGRVALSTMEHSIDSYKKEGGRFLQEMFYWICVGTECDTLTRGGLGRIKVVEHRGYGSAI